MRLFNYENMWYTILNCFNAINSKLIKLDEFPILCLVFPIDLQVVGERDFIAIFFK